MVMELMYTNLKTKKAHSKKYLKHLIRLGTKVAVREAGLARLEGKEYIVQDSDVIEFKFNV